MELRLMVEKIAPVEVGSLSHDLLRVLYMPVVSRISEPSTVVLVQFSELQPSQCAYPKPKHPIWGDRQTIRLYMPVTSKLSRSDRGGEWSGLKLNGCQLKLKGLING